VILFLHHAYRVHGGEEAAVAALRRVVEEELGEPTTLLSRDSGALSGRRAAAGLLRGGLDPGEVARAVRESGARVVHAHNLLPTFGPRALEAARAAGARVVLHLHNYRLVCAVGTCVTGGEDCTRCHGRDTVPGVRLNCRGDRAEAAVYAAGIARAQRRLVAAADVIAVPSAFARERLLALGAPLDRDAVRVVPHPLHDLAVRSEAGAGRAVVVAGRLAPEKGVEVAIDAATVAGLPLRIAGDGPQRAALEARASGRDVLFLGRVDRDGLRHELEGAGLAVVPTRAAETFGLAAAEAMAAGVPVVASRAGALSDLLPEQALVPPGDVAALAEAMRERWRDEAAGTEGLERVRERCAPARVAEGLRALYD
jgi:glycosyltransferase involved in cell wall biosynthesis